MVQSQRKKRKYEGRVQALQHHHPRLSSHDTCQSSDFCGIKPSLHSTVFYFEVQESLKNNPEPPANHKINESKGVNKWIYGLEQYLKSDAVVIHRNQYNFKKGVKIGHSHHTFDIDLGGSFLIVGWEVVSNRIDGHNGSWRKTISQILLTHRAAIMVESGYDRAMNWSLIVYYVDAKDYQFE